LFCPERARLPQASERPKKHNSIDKQSLPTVNEEAQSFGKPVFNKLGTGRGHVVYATMKTPFEHLGLAAAFEQAANKASDAVAHRQLQSLARSYVTVAESGGVLDKGKESLDPIRSSKGARDRTDPVD
jgi:hypothetical protein